jgi:hypothetical protein
MKVLALMALLCCPCIAHVQSRGNDGVVTKSYSADFRGSIDVSIVPEEHAVLRINTWSKWAYRNGSGKAMFRVSGIPFVVSEWIGARTQIAAKYVNDMRDCRLSLKLSDGDSFPLGEVPLDMTDLVDTEGNKCALEGIGSIKMSENDYLEFARRGGWTLGWTCPNQ